MHQVDLLLLLVLFRLLGHLEVLGVEDLVAMQSVRIRVKLFVVELVDALKFAVALGDASD